MAPFPRSCRSPKLSAAPANGNEPAPGALDHAAEQLLSSDNAKAPALVAFVHRAGPEGLKALTTRTRVRLVQGLIDQVEAQGGQRTPEQTAALVQLWRATNLDPVFAQWQAEKVYDLAAQIHNDPKVARARQQWPELSDRRKLQVLTGIARRHARAMGVEPVPVVGFEEPARGNMMRHARFLPEERRIEVNTAPRAALHNFTQALVTILHENTHNLQTQWAEQLERGELSPESPLYLQAALFAVNQDRAGYVSADEDFAAYQQQPLEDHAEGVAQAIVRRALSPGQRAEVTEDLPVPTASPEGLLDLTERYLGRGRRGASTGVPAPRLVP